jgi:hypothetical protein
MLAYITTFLEVLEVVFLLIFITIIILGFREKVDRNDYT